MGARRRAMAMGLGLLCAAPAGAGEVKSVSAAVANVEEPAGADGVLQLVDGTRCTLARNDPRFAVWIRLLKGAQKAGLPVYLDCPDGAARTILPFAARRIEKVDAAVGEKAPVTIFMSPSIHHLRTDRADYAATRALLEEAAKGRQPLLLAVDPKTLEILAAQKPAEGAKVTPI